MVTLAPGAVAGDPQPSRELFALLDELDVPRGHRAEILDGSSIAVSASPVGKHQRNVRSLDLQLIPHLPKGFGNETGLEIRIPHLVRSVTPDLFVAPAEVVSTDEHCISTEGVLLVAEVVSKGNRRNDCVLKLDIYARAAVELYLMVDPIRRQTALFSHPSGAAYKDQVPATSARSSRSPNRSASTSTPARLSAGAVSLRPLNKSTM